MKFPQRSKLAQKTVHKSREESAEAHLNSFFRDKDIAPWFRGTSIFHLNGCNALLHAIRDDIEQGSVHRVLHCLQLIGIDPLISSSQIRTLMLLSRGSDLAFLWFMLEHHYKTAGPDYSINEQLICSAIVHLDMVTTLRELNKILPRPCKTKDVKQKVLRAKKEQHAAQLDSLKQNRQLAQLAGNQMSYFLNIPRPRAYGKSIFAKYPDFKANLALYAHYDDLSFVVENESKRWFANYEFSASSRIVQCIIRDVIVAVFVGSTSSSIRGSMRILCRHHQRLEEKEKCRKMIACLQRYFGNDEKKKNKINRVKAMLECHITKKYNEFQKQIKPGEKLTPKAITAECKTVNVILGAEYVECRKTTKSNTQDLQLCRDKCESRCKQILRNKQNGDENTANRNCGFAISDYCAAFDYGHFKNECNCKPIETYFKAPKNHSPFAFDYKKIYATAKNEGVADESNIRKLFLKALDENYFNKFDAQEEPGHLDLNHAASNCARNIWNNEVSRYNRENCEKLKQESQRPLNQYPIYGNYDYKDKKLMDQMLMDAFTYLRKNPKFVWAQLPEAHKISAVREWLYQRFGKTYSHKDRLRSYHRTMKLFYALEKTTLKSKMPTIHDLGANNFISYNCHGYLYKKIGYLNDSSRARFNKIAMERSRTFWYAMRHYICSCGTTRQIFFAYMPSCSRDLKYFRTWKPYEYRNCYLDRLEREKKRKY